MLVLIYKNNLDHLLNDLIATFTGQNDLEKWHYIVNSPEITQ